MKKKSIFVLIVFGSFLNTNFAKNYTKDRSWSEFNFMANCSGSDYFRKEALFNAVYQNWAEKAKAQGINVVHYAIDFLAKEALQRSEFRFVADVLKRICARNRSLLNEKFDDGKDPVFYVVEKFRKSPFLVSLVKKLLKMGANPNSCDKSGWSLLHYAALYQDFDLAELLVSFEANVSVSTNDGLITPLHIVCAHGDVETFDLLMNKGANKNVCDWFKCLPLHYAAGKGMVIGNNKTLFDIKAFDASKKIDPEDYKDQINSRTHMIERLMIEGNLNCLQKDRRGHSAYEYAKVYEHTALCSTMQRLDNDIQDNRNIDLFNKYEENKTEEFRCDSIGSLSSWIAAAEVKNIPLLQYIFRLVRKISSLSEFDLIYEGLDCLLKYNPQLITEKIENKEPIFYAVESLLDTSWVKPIVEILLTNGANADSCDSTGLSILHLAIKGDNWELFKTIADKHADLMVYTKKEKNSLLHWACFYGNKKIFDFLLDHHVDVNFADYNDDTALHFAAGCGYAYPDGSCKFIYFSADGITSENKNFYEEQTAIRKYMIKRLVRDFKASLTAEDNVVCTAQDFAYLFGHKELREVFEMLKNESGIKALPAV